MPREMIRRLSDTVRVDIVYENENGELTAYFDSVDDSPLMKDPALRQALRAGASAQLEPFVMRDDFDAYYTAQQYKNGWLFLGPMCNAKLDPLRRSAFYRSHCIRPEDVRQPRSFTMRQIKDISVLTAAIVRREVVEEADFVVGNPVKTAGEDERNRGLSQAGEADEADREEEAYKHTYREEQQLLQAAREGRTADVIRLSEKLDEDSGRLSSTDIGHWRTLAVVGITLVSRAAIEGGVPPETAYRLSGYYIGKCTNTEERAALRHYRNQAIEDLVNRVNEIRKKPQGYGYTAKCRDYIQKHFREKIYIEDIAEPMGISAGYLAKLFRKETGLSIQEYVNQVRVERAANLLIYSDKSLPAIADYVHFPTQSYFGKIFRELKGMTPNEYRRKNQVHEFHEE
ncbi:MAG: helix-turn-helix transcriptional regulator [Oscillospiraceae bacterium]|nr:helix-turn-helix transcriptional regulator [Oscillospiraceae bacterium]